LVGLPEYTTFAPDETFAVIALLTATDNFPPELPLTVKEPVLKFSKLTLPLDDMSTFKVFDLPTNVTSPELELLIDTFSAFSSPVIFPAELKSIVADVAAIRPAVSFPAEERFAVKLIASIGSNISNDPAELKEIELIAELL
jgi:hypothetical protein